MNCFSHCVGVRKSPRSSWNFCKNTLSNTLLVKSFLWYTGYEKLQHSEHNSLLLLENKSYSKWHEMKVGKGWESGDISRNRKEIIAFHVWFCLNSAYILQTQTVLLQRPVGSQGVRFLADKIKDILRRYPTKGESGLCSCCLYSEDVNLWCFFSAADPLFKFGQDMLLPHPPSFQARDYFSLALCRVPGTQRLWFWWRSLAAEQDVWEHTDSKSHCSEWVHVLIDIDHAD